MRTTQRNREAGAFLFVYMAAAAFPALAAGSGSKLEVGSTLGPIVLPAEREESIAAGLTLGAFQDLPAMELQPASGLDAVPSDDRKIAAFGSPTGEIAIVGHEDLRIWSRYSSDGGATFGPEVTVAGPDPVIEDFAALLSRDGHIYLFLAAGDPQLGVGIRFTRSHDLGQTWTAPIALTAAGDPAHVLVWGDLATGPDGHAAIVWSANEGHDLFVSATQDWGASWTVPVRVDGASEGFGNIQRSTVAVDDAGRIQVAYAEDQGFGAGIYHTVSSDGGLTFAPPIAVSVPLHQWSANPHLAVAADGNLLLSFFDSASDDHVYVLRSSDGGTTYVTVLDALVGGDTDVALYPTLVVDPSTSTTFLHYVTTERRLMLWRSTDYGATWPSSTIISITATGYPPYAVPFTEVSLLQTSPRTWVIAWSDMRYDSFFMQLTDVWARASTDGGVTWGTEARVTEGKLTLSGASWLTGATAYGANNVFIVYEEGRDTADRSNDAWANRSGVPLLFGADTRVDLDSGFVPPITDEPTVVSDGASHLYYAFGALTTGNFPDIFVASSTDGGLTFSTPVRVGSMPAGTTGMSRSPILRAFPDGHVYLLYQYDDPNIPPRHLRFNRSTDFGATWEPLDILITLLPSAPGYYDNPYIAPRLAATPDGTVYVVWSDRYEVRLRRSTDFGVTFSANIPIDQDPTGAAIFPLVCADGDQLVVSYASPVPALTHYNFYAVVSEDRGASFAPRAEVRNPAVGESLAYNDMACGPAGTQSASVVWTEWTNPPSSYSNRFDGTTWSGPAITAPILGESCFAQDVEFTSATGAMVGFDCEPSVYVGRSTDGGATYPFVERVDDAAPEPDAASYNPRIVADGSGNAWVSFFDGSAGRGSLVARHSADGGASFGPLLRINRELPQGSRGDWRGGLPLGRDVAGVGGKAWFAWVGTRNSFHQTALLNRWNANDLDGDGVGPLADCDDFDPTVFAIPAEVSGEVLEKIPGAVRIHWTSQDPVAGPGTSYSVLRGDLAALRSGGDFSGGSCFEDAAPDSPVDDAGALAPGQGVYYLVRAYNACGAGGWGDSTEIPDPRDDIDGLVQCP